MRSRIAQRRSVALEMHRLLGFEQRVNDLNAILQKATDLGLRAIDHRAIGGQ
jgi:hypothetical protein